MGVRTSLFLESCGLEWDFWLLVLTVAAMLPGLGKDADAVGKLGGLLCLAQLPVMLYAIFPTERALKKNV